MTLRRVDHVELEDWRSWQGTKNVENLPSGLVVLAGPNAQGKTGLWEAIVAALLDRHWGKHTERLRPAGTKGVLPRVRLEFRAGDRRLRVEKHFGGTRDRARLEEFAGDAWTLRDKGEEAYLLCRRAVLGTDNPAPNRGGPDKALGDTLMEVLLAPQGRLTAEAPAPDAISAAVTDREAADTATRIGRILTVVSRQADELWVGKRNRPPKGTDLDVWQTRLEEIRKDREPLEARAEEIQQLVNRLTRASEMLSGHDEAEAQNAQAIDLRREVRTHREGREAALEKEGAGRQAKEDADRLLADREARVKAVTDLGADVEEARKREQRLAEEMRRLADRQAREIEGRDRVSKELRQHREWVSYEKRGGELELTDRELAGIRERIATSDQAEEEIRRLEAKQESLLLPSDGEWKEWDDLQQRHSKAEGRLEAGAWSVAGDVPRGVRLTVDGQAVEDDAVDRKVTRELSLSDAEDRILRVESPPGGAQRVAALAAEIREFFDRFSVTDITELRTRNEYVKSELRRDLALARQRREGALLDGTKTDLLRAELDLESRRESLQAEQAPETDRPDGLPGQWALLVKRLDPELKAAQERVESVGTEFGSVRGLAQDADRSARQKEQDREVAAAALDRHRADHGTDEELRAIARDRSREHGELRVAWRKFEDARPMAEDAKEERADGLSAGLKELLSKQEEVLRLDAEIEALRRDDPEGRLALLDAEEADLLPRVRQAETKAGALRLIERSLAEEKQRVIHAIGQPVRRRIQSWVRYLFQDDSEVVVDDHGRPTVLRTPAGLEVPIVDQSFGTREQVSILYRLAVADLVSEESGAGVCLMLDDPFGHTDRGRRERMLEILGTEARRRDHQILIFTCRPEDFTGVGHHVSLAD